MILAHNKSNTVIAKLNMTSVSTKDLLTLDS